MNKQELINKMADKLGFPKLTAENALKAILDSITEALCEGDTVQLTGFGSFATIEKAERTGRNPQTGKEMTIPATKYVKFKPGKSLKDAVNNK